MVADAFDYYADLAEKLDRKQNEKIENGLGSEFETTTIYDPVGFVGKKYVWMY